MQSRKDGPRVIWRLMKFLLILAFLAIIAFIVFAYVGPLFMADEFMPDVQQRTAPVTLEIE